MARKQFLSTDSVSPSEENLVNLTPLIDVIFIILIAFILIAPLLRMDQVSLAKSGSDEHLSVKNQSILSIYLKEDGSIKLNNKKVSLFELKKELSFEKSQKKDLIPQLFPDKNVRFGDYQQVKDVVESCGFDKLDIILEPN